MWTTILLLIFWFGGASIISIFACALSTIISSELSLDNSSTPFLNHESEEHYENPPCFDCGK